MFSTEYVSTLGKLERSVEQCKDKLQYYGQEVKKKRQGIDQRFPTGSGQKGDGDYLDDEEQAICDWIGEDISLGMFTFFFLFYILC